MKSRIIIALLFSGLLFGAWKASGQAVAVKTNLIYWGTTTPNLAVEAGLGKRTTLDLVGTYNPFTFSKNAKIKHYTIQPEFRRWNCERFNRGFWGIHATWGEFNAGNIDMPFGLFSGLKNNRYEGYMVGGGVSYGYQWYLGPHWNLEATIGVGYLYLDYGQWGTDRCDPKKKNDTYHYFGPTKVGISFVYLFKSKK